MHSKTVVGLPSEILFVLALFVFVVPAQVLIGAAARRAQAGEPNYRRLRQVQERRGFPTRNGRTGSRQK